jgi:hypothetical protein
VLAAAPRLLCTVRHHIEWAGFYGLQAHDCDPSLRHYAQPNNRQHAALPAAQECNCHPQYTSAPLLPPSAPAAPAPRQDLSNLLYSLAVWRVSLSQPWLQACLEAFRATWGAAGTTPPALVRGAARGGAAAGAAARGC